MLCCCCHCWLRCGWPGSASSSTCWVPPSIHATCHAFAIMPPWLTLSRTGRGLGAEWHCGPRPTWTQARAPDSLLHPRPCRQGHFDPPESLPWAGLNTSVIGSPQHVATARELAAKGCVLLKNDGVSVWACLLPGCRRPRAPPWMLHPPQHMRATPETRRLLVRLERQPRRDAKHVFTIHPCRARCRWTLPGSPGWQSSGPLLTQPKTCWGESLVAAGPSLMPGGTLFPGSTHHSAWLEVWPCHGHKQLWRCQQLRPGRTPQLRGPYGSLRTLAELAAAAGATTAPAPAQSSRRWPPCGPRCRGPMCLSTQPRRLPTLKPTPERMSRPAR